MTTILDITLSRGSSDRSEKHLKYRLNGSDIAQRFCQLVATANRDNAELAYSWGMYVDDSHVPELFRRLREHIERFNAFPGTALRFPRVDYKSVSQFTLNQIHEIFDRSFHAISEDDNAKSPRAPSTGAPLEQYRLLHEINHLVHRLESSLEIEHYRQQNIVCAWFAARFHRDWTHDYNNVPLLQQDYDLFRLSEEFGGLYLNYGRYGKCLYDIYLSDDLAALKEGYKARPQSSMEAGIISLFGNYTKTHELELKRFYDWWDRHNISAFGYRKEDPRNTLGHIQVGCLIPSEDNCDLYDAESGRFDEFSFVQRYSPFSVVTSMKCLTAADSEVTECGH